MAKSRKNITPTPANQQKELSLTIPQKQVLSKSQQTFNRLVKRIENLQKEITDTEQLLSEKMEYYGKHIHPLEKQLIGLRKQIVKLLFPFYIDKKPLAKKDKHLLRNILVLQFNNILAGDDDDLDDDLKQIFEALQGVSFAEAEQQDLQKMKQEMADTFERMGFKMDFSDLDGNISPEDMARKINELEGQLFEQAATFKDQQQPRKKTKKQLEKEAREKQIAAIKNKSLSRIYKQLAKLLHPDLEQDPDQKMYKELRMRELTAAYEKKDLHTLLRLELEWIQKEENNLEQLTEDKLNIYNEVLKEQATELEQEKYALLEHPRFQALRRFVMYPEQLKYLSLTRDKKDLNENIKSLEKSILRLHSESALDEVKDVITIFSKYRF